MKHRKLFFIPILLLLLASMAVFAITATPYNVFSPSAERTGFDPLSDTEIAQAANLVPSSNLRSSGADSASAVLLIERHREEKEVMADGQWDRRADIYQYNYATDETTYSLVNLVTGEVDYQEVATNIQLQITQAEIDRALEIVLADKEIWAELVDFYSYFEPDNVLTPADVTADAFTFRSDAEGITEGAVANCGLERCADMFLYVADDRVAVTRPIVNLSTGEIMVRGQ